MAKYKVLNNFKDIHTNEVYKKNKEIELSEDRAAEVKRNLKDKGEFIELIPKKGNTEDFDREAVKERLKELGVEFNGNAKNETLQKLLEENEETEGEKVEGDE